MQRKAQNLIEVSLLAMLVAIITISVWAIYNNQKEHLAGSSKSNINQQSVNLNGLTPDSLKLNDKVPYNGVETAGALSVLGNMSSEDFNSAMSNITYKQLSAALKSKEGGKDLLQLANELATELNGKNPALNIPSPAVKEDDINVDTLSVLTQMLNAIGSKKPEEMSANETAYVSRIKVLVSIANASKSAGK